MGDVSPTPYRLLVEAVVFWSIGFVIWIGRLISRIISNGGIKNLQPDDYIMVVTFAFYTSLLILIQVSAQYATNLFTPEELPEIIANPEDVANRIYGSKIVIALEQCMLFSTWGVKTCLITVYWKLTQSTRWHLFVKYWAVPPENPQCATYQHYSITQAVFNLSSDACMLVIPVPLLKGTQMPLRKKILLMTVFGLGIFVIIAAILNKYFNFHSPLTTVYQLWYIREASTAIYIANLMCWWPLVRKIFGNALSQSNTNYANKYGRPCAPLGALPGAADSSHKTKRWWCPKTREGPAHLSTSTSQEAINLAVCESQPEVPLKIWRNVEYNVQENADAKR
ncbi:hypothetical protein AOCH_001980 [Aspergillus ochraceoroseus]|uniref:Rhodopsin domain-containing protein n=1 Tax=Aspergillus ochraceoroseus TaxID=138278 RepID=A0A0F8URQ6_9EURO|nr:hypothetical protein AOCH_001980 [Aspergillus ochraceoroseus]